MVTQELAAHDDMQKIAASETLPRYKSFDIVSAMLEKHSQIVEEYTRNPESHPEFSEKVRSLRSFKKDLNYKVIDSFLYFIHIRLLL